MRQVRIALVVGILSFPNGAKTLAQSTTNYIYPHTVSWYWVDPNDGGVSSKLATASSYLKLVDPTCAGLAEARACVDLIVTNSSPSSTLPQDITNSTDMNTAFNVAGNIKVPRTISYCGNEVGTFGGCAEVGARNMVVARNASPTVLAHEAGHNQGLYPNLHPPCFRQIMYGTDFGGKALIEEDAVAFRTPLPGYQYSIGTPCPIVIPDVTHSYFVPQAGSYASPVEGDLAVANFRGCPNNDGQASFYNTARIKVVLKDGNGAAIGGVSAAEVYLKFNGGTAAQNFFGVGADSIIANSAYNFIPLCPDVRNVTADGPTDANGVTYITFTGSGGVRDPSRKWGHYDNEIPVLVNGVKLDGRYTSNSANGSYQLRIKSFDWSGGLLGSHPSDDNIGEYVDNGDYNGIANGIGISSPVSFWKDFDSSGAVGPSDFNMIVDHVTHNCDTPH